MTFEKREERDSDVSPILRWKEQQVPWALKWMEFVCCRNFQGDLWTGGWSKI